MRLMQEEELGKLMTKNVNETMYLDEFMQGDDEELDEEAFNKLESWSKKLITISLSFKLIISDIN